MKKVEQIFHFSTAFLSALTQRGEGNHLQVICYQQTSLRLVSPRLGSVTTETPVTETRMVSEYSDNLSTPSYYIVHWIETWEMKRSRIGIIGAVYGYIQIAFDPLNPWARQRFTWRDTSR